MAITVATLEERVTNHIKFFWVVVGFGFVWLSGLTLVIYHINDTANRIAKNQAGIENSFVSQSLAIYAALPLDEFKTKLPDIASAITKAKQQRATAPPRVVDELQSKLALTETSAPYFWPTVAVLITYHSSSVVGSVQDWSRQFLPCRTPQDLDSQPNANVQKLSPDGKPIGPKIPILREGGLDCYVELDGQKISRWDCTRCLVKYSGGPLSMRDVNFNDCLFVLDFRSQQPPSPDGQLLSRMLLTSELKYVTIPA